MTVRRISDTMSMSLSRVAQRLTTLPREAYRVWVQETPVRSGNARRRTQLRGDTIDANYPYARRLDEGYSSQSPQGMSRPTERFVRNRLRTMLRK
jgi:hypothetical protein